MRKCLRSKVPDNAAASENIVLTGLACGHIQLRYARPEVSTFTAEAEVPEDLYIKSNPPLQCTGSGPGFARVCPSKQERGTFTEVAKSGAKTDPRRNRHIGKEIHPGSGSHKERRVLFRDQVLCSVQILDGIYYERDFP